jgi:hypothetical protein
MAMVLGPLLFLGMFLMICGETRNFGAGLISGFFHWIDANQPVSYFVLMGLGVAALLSMVLIVRWPGIPEADNPLAQYKREHPEMED